MGIFTSFPEMPAIWISWAYNVPMVLSYDIIGRSQITWLRISACQSFLAELPGNVDSTSPYRVLFSLKIADYTSFLFFKIVNSVKKVGLYITSSLLFDRPLTSQRCII
jgi:hypothetical protein